jgi:pilus assembly protein CpaB
MNRRILLIVSCALVLSVCASYLVYRAVGAKVSAAKTAPTAELVVAARDLAVGTLVHDGDVKIAPWLGPVPVGAIVARGGFLNRGVISSIYAGEPLTDNRLAPKGSGGGLAATIPPGMRACAVKVNEVVGVAGFVVPGMRVDVLVSGLPPGGNPLDGPRVRTLLQNIEVLSAGTNFQKDQEGKPEQAQVVNLLVTPAQAELLSLASNETHIQLVLRNPMDTQISGLPGTILSDLYGNARAPGPVQPDHAAGVGPKSVPTLRSAPRPAPPVVVVEPAAPVMYTIDVLNGSARSQAKFSRPVGKQ